MSELRFGPKQVSCLWLTDHLCVGHWLWGSQPGVPTAFTCGLSRPLTSSWDPGASQSVPMGVVEPIVFPRLLWSEAALLVCTHTLSGDL